MKNHFFVAAVAALAIMACSCGTTSRVKTTGNPTGVVSEKIVTGPEGKVKEWQSQGYMIDGTRTMYDKLVIHYNRLDSNPDKYIELQGSAVGTEKADARLYALNAAAIQYATAARGVVEGGLTRQMGNLSDSAIKLMGGYTQKVQAAIGPFLQESVAVYRKVSKKGNDMFEYDIYYILDENSAYNVRKNAMEQALKETALEQVFGQSVDEWVKSFVRPTEE